MTDFWARNYSIIVPALLLLIALILSIREWRDMRQDWREESERLARKEQYLRTGRDPFSERGDE